MGLLIRGRRRMLRGLGLLALAVAGGCALLQGLGLLDEPLAFSHEAHLEQGFSCTDCHSSWEGGDAPQPITQALCATCHDGLDEQAPPERRVAGLFRDGAYQPLHLPLASADLIFSHARHVEGGLDCESCHAGAASSDSTAEGLLPSMRECQDCHAALGLPNDCATCHSTLRQDVAPGSHGEAWRLLHGHVARSGDPATANDCAMCHVRSGCDACHAEERPRSHTGLFRLKAHGVMAATDRDSCVTCHTKSFCQRCHEETRPLGHAGSFGGTLNTHCLSCHFPLSSETGCTVCHPGTPSHELATPQPPDHVPGMNCTQCHGAGAPLPHVDKGDNCTICHQ